MANTPSSDAEDTPCDRVTTRCNQAKIAMKKGGTTVRTYRKTLRGRLDGLARGLRERSRRAAAGSIAVIIGALGATALLATTLVLPDTPLQRIFATPSGTDLGSRFEDTQRIEVGDGTGERTIEVDTRTSRGTDVLGPEGSGPELAGDQVLGTVVASGSSGPDLVTNGADAGGKNSGDGTGPKEVQSGSTSGSGSGEGSGSGDGSGSGGTVPATKPEDDDDDDDERDDDRRSPDDSDSGSSDSRDSRADSRGSEDSKDSDSD